MEYYPDRNTVFAYAEEVYGVKPDYPWKKAPQNGVLRHEDTRKWFGIVMPAPKKYLGTGDEGYEDVLTIKCEPLLIDSLVQTEGYHRAYHMNKTQWLSMRLDGTVPREKLFCLLDMSFALTDKKQE